MLKNLRVQGGRSNNILFGLFFMGMGSIFLFAFWEVSLLECRRVTSDQVNCQLKHTLMRLVPLSTRDVDRVASAQVDESCDSDGCTYRVTLNTDNGPVGLTPFYSSGYEPKQSAAREINQQLANNQQGEFTIRAGGTDGMTCFAGIPMLFFMIGFVIFIRSLFPW